MGMFFKNKCEYCWDSDCSCAAGTAERAAVFPDVGPVLREQMELRAKYARECDTLRAEIKLLKAEAKKENKRIVSALRQAAAEHPGDSSAASALLEMAEFVKETG